MRPIGRLIEAILSSAAGIVLLVALVIALAVWFASRYGANARTERARSRTQDVSTALEESLDIDELEAAAVSAEAAGDYSLALRLRFRHGLVTLRDNGAIELRPSMTSAQVGRRLRSPVFDGLARTFDAVVYGGRRASSDDLLAARDGWRHVVASVPASSERAA